MEDYMVAHAAFRARNSQLMWLALAGAVLAVLALLVPSHAH